MTQHLTTITTAQREYYARPADERMPSLDGLLAAATLRRQASKEIKYTVGDLRIVPAGDGVQLQSPKGLASLTPWSHSQLARMVGAPASYLRTLPGPIAADALNHGLRAMDASTVVNVLGQVSEARTVTARAVTSETYGRLWESELYTPIVETLGRAGWALPPTWDGQPAGAYLSDRDSFLVLANGGSIVEDPSLRGSNGGGDGAMYRALLVRNSEVGAGSAVIERVLFQYICGNHCLWGAVIDRTFRRRHVGARVLVDVLREVRNVARDWMSRPASADEAIIRGLMTREVASTRDDVVKALQGMGSTKAAAEAAYTACEQHFPASPRSFWGLSQGYTQTSQASGHQDVRLELDLFASQLLARGARQLQAA